jgi:hypothetical protein
MQELPLCNWEKLNLTVDGKELGMAARGAFAAYRAKVPGGWLIAVTSTEGTSGVSFYPDPRHEWNGGTLD